MTTLQVACRGALVLWALGLALPSPAATHQIQGTIQCRVLQKGATVDVAIPRVRVRIDNGAGAEGVTDANGVFHAAVTMMTDDAALRLVYEGNITALPNISTPLQVMNDGHQTRSDTQEVKGTVSGDTLDLGTVAFASLDCELYRIGVELLEDYHGVMHESPKAGKLRIKRWEGVIVGTAHTDYDYIPVPTDFMSDTEQPNIDNRECALFHEFGHDIWFSIDGGAQHWRNDLMDYGYARGHEGNEITNVHYAWSEGWADYWSAAKLGCIGVGGLPAVPDFTDWNEWNVSNALLNISNQIGRPAMVEVLKAHPGGIHSLHEFVVAAQASHPGLVGLPAAPPVCPVGFRDDGATCRRDTVAKPSVTRGAGVVPTQCDANAERSGALCYPRCPPGFVGNGPVCWQTCPAGFTDDGATCRRDAKIIGADNSSCPVYDKCGLTFSKGCSKCPAGFSNDGCTCRVDVKIFGKASSGRGAGSPLQCGAGQQKDAGLCYSACSAGFSGAGPVCWGSCPVGTRDDGATCWQASLVLIK